MSHLFLFSTLLALLVPAAEARTIALGLDDAPAFVLRHNRALAAARLRIEEARGRFQQSGRLANPELEGSIEQNVRMPERAAEIGFSQRFPLTARLRLEKAVSRAELAAAEEEVRDEERRALAAARAGLVRLLANGSQRTLRETQLANSRQVAELTLKRVEAAEASAAEATLVSLEARQLETELLQLGVERAAILGELRPLLGLGPGDDVAVRGTLDLPARPPAAADVSARPDFRAAQRNVEAARSSAELARAQKWEDITLGLSLRSEYAEDAPEGFERDEMVGFRFSLPLPLWNDNAGRIREADAAAVRRRREVEALALSIRDESAAAREEMAALARVVATMNDTLLPQARQVEEQLRLANLSAQASVPDVLRARDRRLGIERQRIDAQRDFHLARVRYEAAAGRAFRGTAAASK